MPPLRSPRSLGGLLLLAWPGLVDPPVRWVVAAALAVLQPVLHFVLQRTPAPGVQAVPLDFLVASAAPAEPLPDVLVADPAQMAAELHAAARSGRVDLALQLLDAGADAHAAPPAGERDQRSLAALAAVLPDLRLLRALIVRGVDLNSGDAGMTPLLAATRDSWHGRPEAVMTLLANGADPRVADADGNTPLHHAARSTDPGVAALLRDAAADIDALNDEGFSPLGVACASGNWRLAKFLLERGARPEPAGGQPALLAAAASEEDDPAGVQLLLKFKAKVTTPGREARTALHEAALAGHAEVAAALLAAGAEPQTADAAGRTPWLEAARALRAGVIEQLATQRIDIAATDAEGRNAPVLAAGAEQASLALVRRLLELGVDPARADHAGRRAVDIAAESGRWAIVSVLDPAYPLPAAVAEAAAENVADERPPLALLHDGLQGGRLEGLSALARLCARAELGGLLHDPALQLRPSVVEWLLSHQADAETCVGGETALTALLGQGGDGAATIGVLLAHGASPAGAGGLARFMAACAQRDHVARSHEQLALDLFLQGADPFAPSPAGDPALSLAVRLGWLRLLDALLEAGVDREVRDGHGMTALHLAAALGRESALKRLVAQGASPDARAADGQTPLGVGPGQRPPRPGRLAGLAGMAAAEASAARGRRGRRGDGRRRRRGAAPARTRFPGRRGRRAGLHRPAARCRRRPRRRGGPAAGARRRSAACRAQRRDSAVGRGEHAPDRDRGRAARCGADLEHRLPGGVTVLMLASALGLSRHRRAPAHRRRQHRRRRQPGAQRRSIAPRCTASPAATVPACWPCSTRCCWPAPKRTCRPPAGDAAAVAARCARRAGRRLRRRRGPWPDWSGCWTKA